LQFSRVSLRVSREIFGEALEFSADLMKYSEILMRLCVYWQFLSFPL
jgi:hypothetical protein